MKRPHRSVKSRANQGGFSIIETIVAIVLLSTVGVIIGQLLQRNTVNLIWNRESRRAAQLADMVMEKYDYLASVNFDILHTFNQTDAPVSDFFVSGTTGEGYEGLRLTTVADAPTGAASGSRKVTVTIKWGAGGERQTYTLTKYLAPGTGESGGAPVYVYVVDQNGNGLPGFEVRAKNHYSSTYVNAFGTNEVIAVTDNTGYAVLNNVSVNPALQPMRITASKIGSDALVPRSDANFVHGYYAPGPTTANAKFITVTQTSANTVRYDMRNGDFFLLGSIAGRLTNTSGGPTENMKIEFNAMASHSSSRKLRTGNWTFTADSTGLYEFNNIAPGAVTIDVKGKQGSDPTIVSGPSFEQGYVGHGGNGANPWTYQVTMPEPTQSIENYNLRLRALGSLRLTVTDSLGPAPNASVDFIWPQISFSGRGVSWTGTTDASGVLTLANLFPGDDQPTFFSAVNASAGCPNAGGYRYQQQELMSAAVQNDVTMNLTPGVTITGTLVGQGTSIPLESINVSIPAIGGGRTRATTDAAGQFTLCGTSASGGVHPNWPRVNFELEDVSGRRVRATFRGYAQDADFNQYHLAGLNLSPSLGNSFIHNVACESDPNPTLSTSDTITTTGVGDYDPACLYMRYLATIEKVVTGGPATYDAGTISASTSTMTGGLTFAGDPYYEATVNNITITYGDTYDPYLVSGRLRSYGVQGTIRDGTNGVALSGIQFDPCTTCFDGPTSCPVTSDADGKYGPVNVCVVNRYIGTAGEVVVKVRNGTVATNTGFTYVGATQSFMVPTPATPSTPMTVDFSLPRSGGGF